MFSNKNFGVSDSVLAAAKQSMSYGSIPLTKIEAELAEKQKMHTAPKTPKEKSLAALATPKDKITYKDVMVGRGVMAKEEAEPLDELSKEKLAWYLRKATKHMDKKGANMIKRDKKLNPGMNPLSRAISGTVQRQDSIAQASKKLLAKEEAEQLFTAAEIEAIENAAKGLGEAKTLIHTAGDTAGHHAKVYNLSGEHNEGDPYHVRLFHGKTENKDADYFTNDLSDAKSTAEDMVKRSSK